ncbi:hypothetical protein CYMTET_53277, partial [Cymbomonas tetramitiformis]
DCAAHWLGPKGSCVVPQVTVQHTVVVRLKAAAWSRREQLRGSAGDFVRYSGCGLEGNYVVHQVTLARWLGHKGSCVWFEQVTVRHNGSGVRAAVWFSR